MEIKSELSKDSLEVTIADCEGFNINERMQFDAAIEYINELIKALSDAYAFIEMDKQQIKIDLRESELI